MNRFDHKLLFRLKSFQALKFHGITLLSVPGSVFAHLLHMRVRRQLLKLQSPELSGFMPDKLTSRQLTDRTLRPLALPVLLERRREYQQGILLAVSISGENSK